MVECMHKNRGLISSREEKSISYKFFIIFFVCAWAICVGMDLSTCTHIFLGA